MRARSVNFWQGGAAMIPKTAGRVRVRIDAEAGLEAKAPYDFYPDRAVLEDEFDQIWDAQAAFWPDVLTDERKAHLFRVMFYQRPLKAAIVGKCSFNPSEPRLAKAHPLFQEFRLIKEVNELELGDAGPVAPETDARPAQCAAGEIAHIKKRDVQITAQDIETLGARRNLQQGRRRPRQALGRRIYAAMSDKAIFGNRWAEMPMERQWEIIEKLRDEADPLLLHAWLVDDAGLSEDAAGKAADAKLPEGYGRLGRTAMSEMLEFMKAEVIPESKAAELAGYDHALTRPAMP
jgi:CRISPR-associated endonuclease Csn1